MIEIDGSQGEGGGQIIRTSLGLSLLTGQPVKLIKVRAKRSRPGLQRQHLVAVLAAAEIGHAKVSGAEINSQEIRFWPGKIVPGEYSFDIGSAGSTTLVLQTLLPPLMMADAPSQLTITGGTHNPLAPTAGFLNLAFAATLARFGPLVTVTAKPFGFYPAGGGQLHVSIEPRQMKQIALHERGEVLRRRAVAYVSKLPISVAERELKVVTDTLGWSTLGAELDAVQVIDSVGPGNVLELFVESEQSNEVTVAFGERGKPAEAVATEACHAMQQYLNAGVPIGEHLADQLLLPLALAGGGSFVTMPLSLHATTNMRTIGRFLPVKFHTREHAAGQWLVEAIPTATSEVE